MPGFTLRPMRAADKPAILAIAARTWEGTDYLPWVFDDWLADRDGEFVAALLGGRVVGCGKLTFLTPADAWLEGLRKDPAVSEGGLAETISRHFLRRLAARPGLASVRFSTYIFNEQSIAANERLGFRRRTAFSCKVWSGKRGELASVGRADDGRAAVTRDPAEVRRFVEASSWLAGSGGVVCEGWKAYPYSWPWFRSRYLETGRCIEVLDAGRLAGFAAYRHAPRSNENHVKLAFAEAVNETTADAVFGAVFRFAQERADETNEIEMILPPGASVGPWAAARGFRSWEREGDFLLYELPLPLLAGFARGEQER